MSSSKDTFIRITTFIAGLCGALVTGTLYGWGAFAPSMKDVFGWTQTQINLVGSIGDLGLYLGFVMGLVYDLTTPWFTLLLGAVLLALGYSLMGLAVAGYFACSWPLMAFFVFLAGQGSFAGFTASYGPSLYNVSGVWRSRVMSSAVAAFAASSMLYTTIFRFLYRVPPNTPHTLEASNLATFLFVIAGSSAGTLLLAALVERKIGPAEEKQQNDEESASLLTRPNPLPEDLVEPVTPLRLLTKLDFWLLAGVYFFLAGPGLLWITVQGSVAKSLGEAAAVDNLVLVLGAASIAGRLVVGFLSDAFVRKWSRAVFLIPCAILMGAAHLSFAFAQSQMLYATATITGLCYGSTYAVGVTMISSLFGKKWAGTNLGILTLYVAISGIILGFVNGALYAQHANVDNSCVGTLCFQYTFIVSGSVTAIALALSIWLTVRTWPKKMSVVEPTTSNILN